MGEPRVSVIVPTFNRPRLLRLAVASIETQTLRDHEIIVVNDGGVPAEGLPAGIKYFEHTERRGLPAARNTGIRESRGRYIAYLDDDDRYLPRHLATLVAALEMTGAGAVYGDHFKVLAVDEGEVFRETERREESNPDFDKDRILLENFLPSNSIVHRRECIEECGYFDEWMTMLEDWDLWLRFSRKFTICHVPERTCEVWTLTNRESMQQTHHKGFAWAALNCLYRCMTFVPDRPDILALYQTKAAEALEHLKLAVLQIWTAAGTSLETAFSFHPPERVIPRLAELEVLYGGILISQFRELRAILFAHLGRFDAACDLFRSALEADPQNGSARTILGMIEKAKGG